MVDDLRRDLVSLCARKALSILPVADDDPNLRVKPTAFDSVDDRLQIGTISGNQYAQGHFSRHIRSLKR